MQIFHVGAEDFQAGTTLADPLPPAGFLWLACDRAEFAAAEPALQSALARWTGGTLVHLHVADLINEHLPSQFDYTSWYDLLVFRRLAAGAGSTGASAEAPHSAAANLLDIIDTRAVGFALFDRVLITVHPAECAVRAYYAQRLAALAAPGDARGAARLPSSPAELMLRMLNHMVDSYLDLRRLLTRQLVGLQQQLLDPKSRFNNWQVLLDSRNSLHLLEDTCEDQRSALQEWLDALDEWPDESDLQARRERELLRVRSRDVLEHIERVLTHVRRLEHSAETAVQMHFSALSHRTNDIMRTLTVLTAIFLPLNLITGFFGMNFDSLPLIHSARGTWVAIGAMAVVGVSLLGFFWRKRYLGTRHRP